ncbi:hypothetical protein GCM10009609_66030 [Pseudonocardia aurantiaca]
MVHIHGPAGSGKSALLHEFCATATSEGALVLTAACSRAEREDPLATVRQLLESAETGAAAGAGHFTAPAASHESHGLVLGITALARDRPVVVAVDDVRYADTQSVRHLLALACRAPWARILIVLTERTSSGYERSTLHDELLGTSAARTVGVTNLTAGGAGSVLAEYGVAADASCVEHHSWVTGGNPLLIHALAPSLGRCTGPSKGSCLLAGRHSPDFRTVVRNLIRSLDQAEVEVLRALAVLSGSADMADLQGVLGTPIARLANVVDGLERVGLLETGRFRDPTVLDEVRADMTNNEHIRWHVRAAGYLLRERAPATAVAAHLVKAGRVPNRRMVDVLQEAATALLAAGDAHEAKLCLDLARRSGPDADQVSEIEFALVRVEHQIAPSSAARRLPSVTSAIPDERLRGAEIADLLEMVCWHSGPDVSGEILARIAGRSAADGRTATELESGWMLLTTVFPGLAAMPRPTVGGEPEPRLYRFARADLLALAWSMLHEGWTAQAAQQSDRLLTPADQHVRDARAVFVTLTVMAVVGRPVSPSVCDQLIDAADSRGALAARAMFLAARADANLARGHLVAAERDARAALDAMPAEAWGVGIGQPVSALVLAITESGRAAAAEPLGISVPDAMYESVFGPRYLYARGCHLLALRQPRAALDDFRSCGLLMARWGLGHDVAVPWRYGAARALVSLGDERVAREFLDDQLADLTGGINRGLALRLAASLSSRDAALRLLSEAQSIFDAAGNGLESARTLAKMSELHDGRGERTTARVKRARARQLAQDLGSPRLVDEFAPASTSTIESRRPAPVAALESSTTVLTDAESRVVDLVVRGHTNREISDRLFVTVSTVEQHLTSVYRKLKVKRRRELAALLAGQVGRQAG